MTGPILEPTEWRAKMDVVRGAMTAWLNQQQSAFPVFLTHYTAAENAIEILNSGTLWLFNARDLNDESELEHATDLIARCLKHRGRKAKGNSEELYSLFQRQLGATYVFCASAGGGIGRTDNLSMWRAYGDNGDGVAIKIRTEAVQSATFANDVRSARVGKVLYDEKDQIEFIEGALDAYQASCLAQGVEGETATYALAETLWSLTPFLKHPAFRDEEEWRMVLSVAPNISATRTPSPIEWHQGRPYIPVTLGDKTPLALVSSSTAPLWGPFEGAMIGPGKNKRAVAARISAAFMRYGIAYPELSAIPYRGRR